MAIKESALAAITSITQSDLIRAVTSAGASRRITVANLAKAIIENYVGSSLAGSSQSVKAALDSLNSNMVSKGTTDLSRVRFSVTTSVSPARAFEIYVTREDTGDVYNFIVAETQMQLYVRRSGASSYTLLKTWS